MAQWMQLQHPYVGRKELISTSCPMTSTYTHGTNILNKLEKCILKSLQSLPQHHFQEMDLTRGLKSSAGIKIKGVSGLTV